MKKLTPNALGLLLLCAAAGPAHSAEPSTKLVVTEGRYIGYTSVAEALASLKSRGLTGTPGANGDVSYVEPGNGTAWTFAAKDNPAYPAVVRYVYARSSGELQAEVTILCEASAERCEKFHADIRDRLAQLAKMMAGDPSANCSVNDGKVKCGAAPERSQTSP